MKTNNQMKEMIEEKKESLERVRMDKLGVYQSQTKAILEGWIDALSWVLKEVLK